jgi:hypothetical protein
MAKSWVNLIDDNIGAAEMLHQLPDEQNFEQLGDVIPSKN